MKVVPVHVARAEVQQAGTPLFKAAGWVEPRPTPILVAALASGVVERLLVVEDQAVETGQPVAELVADMDHPHEAVREVPGCTTVQILPEAVRIVRGRALGNVKAVQRRGFGKEVLELESI